MNLLVVVIVNTLIVIVPLFPGVQLGQTPNVLVLVHVLEDIEVLNFG